MLVCRPQFSFDDVFGLEVLNPRVEFLIPMALRQVMLKEVGNGFLHDEVGRTQDAVLLILSHPSLDLLFHLVDGAERAMEFAKLVVAAFVIGAPEVVPCVVMLHLYGVEPTSVMTGEVTTIEEVGTGVGGDEILNQNVEIDGNQMRVVKALVKASNFIDGFKII